MGKQTKAQKIKEKIKKRKEFEKALLKDMEKNMGKSNYMRGMGLMLRPAPPRPPKIKLTQEEKARMKAGKRLAR